MAELSRKQRRIYLVKTGYYKRISSLRFNHPDRINHRQMSRQQGEYIHQKFIEEIQQKLSEFIAPREKKMIELLKSKGLEKSDIDSYMEKWIDINFWPKSKDYINSKKELKKLNKKYGI